MCFPPPSAPAGQATDRLRCFPKESQLPHTNHPHSWLGYSLGAGTNQNRKALTAGVPWDTQLMSGSAVIAGGVGDRSYSLALWRALPECDKKQPLPQSPGPCCGRDTAGGSSLRGGGSLGFGGGSRKPEGDVEDTPVTLMQTEADIHFVRSICI